MGVRRFVAQRVGDQYVTVPAEGQGECAGWTIGGGMLLGLGLLRGGAFGTAATLAGAGLIYRGLTGRNPLDDILGSEDRARAEGGASYANEPKRRSTQRPDDVVEEASMESFPASDPPST